MKRTAPPTIFAGGFGNNRMIASAVNDLPQPDSPTMARVSPAETVSDRPSTAGNTPRRVNNDTCRFFDREDWRWNGFAAHDHLSDPAAWG
jgi:hypothetical protein